MEYKYVSKNCMEQINLHDCSVSGYSVFGADLVLKFEYIYIMDSHPLNTSGISKYTGEACILFEDYSAINPVYLKYESIAGQNERKYVGTVSIDFFSLLNKFEVAEVTPEENKNEPDGFFYYKFFGYLSREHGCNFAEFHLRCRSISVFWNELEGDAWFDSPHPNGVATAPDGSAIWIVGNGKDEE